MLDHALTLELAPTGATARPTRAFPAGDRKRTDAPDFTRAFLSESLARVASLRFLTPSEQRTLNQIRGYGFLHAMWLAEQFTLPFFMDQAGARLQGGDTSTRALLAFVGGEAERSERFDRFASAFEDGFDAQCKAFGPADVITEAVLAYHPLTVALFILQLEWAMHRHYIATIKYDKRVDRSIKRLLEANGFGEPARARLAMQVVKSIAARYSPEERSAAIAGYGKLALEVDGALDRQAKLDRRTLMNATGRRLSDAECAEFFETQRQALRWTFLGAGMSHPEFLRVVDELDPKMARRIEQIAPAFS